MELTDAQIERYSRQIILPAIGGRGQQRLLETTVSVIGDGPLASTAALYLTAAGIGCLELWTSTADGRAGMQVARQELIALNPDITVLLRTLDSPGLAPAAWRTAALVCADVTAPVLALANRAALRQGAPLVAGVAGIQPRMTPYAGHDARWPCTACDPEPPVRASAAPGPDATAGVIGSLLALAAVQSGLGLPGAQPGRALHYDPETLTIAQSSISKRANCRACALAGGLDV